MVYKVVALDSCRRNQGKYTGPECQKLRFKSTKKEYDFQMTNDDLLPPSILKKNRIKDTEIVFKFCSSKGDIHLLRSQDKILSENNLVMSWFDSDFFSIHS